MKLRKTHFQKEDEMSEIMKLDASFLVHKNEAGYLRLTPPGTALEVWYEVTLNGWKVSTDEKADELEAEYRKTLKETK